MRVMRLAIDANGIGANKVAVFFTVVVQTILDFAKPLTRWEINK